MTTRPPASLQSRLRAAHARVRRALIARHALRATAAAVVLLTFCVTAGLALPRDPVTAGLRLGLFALGSLAALAYATLALRRETPRWETWLESLERRFTDIRSWVRNAIDLEKAAAPARAAGAQGSNAPSHTSGELADAVRAHAEHRLDGVPLRDTVPPIAGRSAFLGIAAAGLSLVAAATLAP